MEVAALELDDEPRSVQYARAWVRRACGDLSRDDLAECAQLAISEVVTNALLHGKPPVRLRVGGTPAHPRFEVADGSPVPPQPPDVAEPASEPESASEPEQASESTTAAADPSALFADLDAFGRGLTLVARASVAWGAELDNDGKTVWFEPAADLAEHGAPFQLAGAAAATAPAATDPVPSDPDLLAADLLDNEAAEVAVIVPDVPLESFVRFRRHFRELRREIRLLSLAHHSAFPQAAALSSYFDVLDRPLRDALGPQPDPRPGATTTLELPIPAARADQLRALAKVLDAADEFCRSERLLTLPRSEEQREFQTWLLGEISRQLTAH